MPGAQHPHTRSTAMQPPSPAMQGVALKCRFPDSELRVRGRTIIWTATLRPTPGSREYTLRITYTPNGSPPRVEVLSDLPSRPGEVLPHVYRDGSLCLHMAGEWSRDMFIADTTVPWACEWLFHYEIWLATGEWHGGGEDPAGSEGADGGNGANDSRRARRARRARSGSHWFRRSRETTTESDV